MTPRTRSCLLLILLAAIGAAYFSRERWLDCLAYPLMRNDRPAKADVAVTLGGEANTDRIEKAAGLVRQGYVPRVLMSCAGAYECDMAIALVVGKGFPEDWFIPVPYAGASTFEEGQVLVADMRRRHIQSFLLVTSNLHTARAGRIFRAFAQASEPKLEMRGVIAAREQYFPDTGWWRIPEGRELFIIEWIKVVATALGFSHG